MGGVAPFQPARALTTRNGYFTKLSEPTSTVTMRQGPWSRDDGYLIRRVSVDSGVIRYRWSLHPVAPAARRPPAAPSSAPGSTPPPPNSSSHHPRTLRPHSTPSPSSHIIPRLIDPVALWLHDCCTATWLLLPPQRDNVSSLIVEQAAQDVVLMGLSHRGRAHHRDTVGRLSGPASATPGRLPADRFLVVFYAMPSFLLAFL